MDVIVFIAGYWDILTNRIFLEALHFNVVFSAFSLFSMLLSTSNTYEVVYNLGSKSHRTCHVLGLEN